MSCADTPLHLKAYEERFEDGNEEFKFQAPHSVCRGNLGEIAGYYEVSGDKIYPYTQDKAISQKLKARKYPIDIFEEPNLDQKEGYCVGTLGPSVIFGGEKLYRMPSVNSQEIEFYSDVDYWEY
jgi:hypothetical protein